MAKKLSKYIDHTILKSFAQREAIEKLCADARKWDFASVCVNPYNVPLAKELLKGSDVKVCTVIGFPLGANTTAIKAAETEDAYKNGCDEFDMVINIGALKDGLYDYVKNDIAAVVKAAKGKTVKVIIETGLITDEEKVMATKLSCEAGADFVKTCTGFTQGKAEVSDIKLMKANCTKGVKVKASSGIRTYEDAMALIEAGADRLGTSSGIAIIEGAEAAKEEK
ncbi:MAG: deoxyribose-phosphate aldolase [Clostridia bacterium]|jgi:deoxyribose-phosphate aldolase|nr:deoxyribose-phosphate aldolase [Clostridia bacterium]